MNRQTFELALFTVGSVLGGAMTIISAACIAFDVASLADNIAYLVSGVVCMIACAMGFLRAVRKGGQS